MAKNWLDNAQFRDFRESLDYARSRTMWHMARLNELTDEQVYWCWFLINRGIEIEERNEDKD